MNIRNTNLNFLKNYNVIVYLHGLVLIENSREVTYFNKQGTHQDKGGDLDVYQKGCKLKVFTEAVLEGHAAETSPQTSHLQAHLNQ